MTFYPQAVQQPSMYKALMQGLQGYQAVKGIQQQSAASERADAAEKRAALGQTAATERQQKYDDIADKERFAKESSQFAATIRGLPTEKKIQRIQERISDLDGRGIPSDTTKRLLDMYQQGTTGVQQARSMEEAEMLGAKVKEADDAIEQRYQMGIQQGYVKAPAKIKGQYRFATPEEKQQAGITDDAPYQVSPKGQFVKLGGKGQTINVNTGGAEPYKIVDPKSGYAVVERDGKPEYIKIKGGPAEQAAQEKITKEKAQKKTTARTANIVKEDIGKLTSMLEGEKFYDPITGISGSLAESIPGTSAVDAEALRTTIGANIGFDRLQAMREASKTGGALGAISEREMKQLESVMGSLGKKQSKEQQLRNLKRLDKIYGGIIEKASAYPGASQFGFGVQAIPVMQVQTPSREMTPAQAERYR